MAKIKMTKMNLQGEPTIREKLFFGVALLGILMLFTNFIWDPQTKQVKRVRGDLKTVEQQADAIRKLIDATQKQLSLRQVQQAAPPKSNERVRRILSRPVGDATDEINSTVDLLGSRELGRRVKIGNVTIGAHQEEKTYTVVPITVDISGRYSGIQSYLELLEAVERPIVVKSFDMKTSSTQPGMLNMKVETQLFVPKR